MSDLASDPRATFVRVMGEALSAGIRDANDNPVPFVAGRLEGPIDDRDIGCVWFEGTRPNGRAAIVGDHFYRVRVFRRWRQTVEGAADEPALHAALLALQAELEAVLAANLGTPPGHDYLVIREVTPDYVQQCVEAQVTAVCQNPTAPGM